MEDLALGLLKLGFKRQEAEIYVALLGVGRAPAGRLAQMTGFPRTSTYNSLKVLMSQGLVTEVQMQERVYIAESPERIRSLLSYQIRELEQKRSFADQLMMRLQVFHQTSKDKPHIRYIESIQGLRMMQQEYESMDADIIQILNYDRFLAIHDPSVTNEHRIELEDQKRRIRSILITDRTHVKPDANAEIILLPSSLAPMEGELTVCGDRVILFAYASSFIAIEIVSQAIASTLRTTLELAWNEAKRISS